MSVPGVDITCDKCDFDGSTAVVFGIFKYITPYGAISLPRRLGWCSYCKSLAPIEVNSSETKLKSLASDFESLTYNISEKRKQLRKEMPFLKRFFSSEPPASEELDRLEAQRAWMSTELLSPAVLKKYLACSRNPRCLTCGSSDVKPFPALPNGLDEFEQPNRHKVPVGMRHPGCEGNLLAATSRFRAYMQFRDRVYSLDGDRVA